MGKPFKIQVVMLVEAVNPHNPLDSAAAILGSFTPPFGAGNDRNQMIYLDSGKIGWADDTQSFAVAVTGNTYHAYELAVGAGGNATLSVDGIQALTRTGFTTNGGANRSYNARAEATSFASMTQCSGMGTCACSRTR